MQGKSRRLNKGQLEVLNLLFKFRFGTSELIATIQQKQNGTTIRSRLNILREHKLIDRHYQPLDKLQGKHAAYYLLPVAVKELEEHRIQTNIPNSVTKGVYKYKTMSRQFIDHCLLVFSICAQLKAICGENIKTFTRPELVSYEYFPKPLPHLFLSVKNDGGASRYFLEVVEPNTPSFAFNRRLREYAEYYESEAWNITGSEFPGILFVCASEGLERKLQRRIGAVTEELNVYTTTLENLKAASYKQDKIWLNNFEESKKSLKEL